MSTWRPDSLLPGFESLELAFPDDYDGAVVATLVRLPAGDAPRGAVLYVHGYTDYFCKRHDEFYAELSRAIEVIGAPVLLAGHSTGGLICALYANEGESRGEVS